MPEKPHRQLRAPEGRTRGRRLRLAAFLCALSVAAAGAQGGGADDAQILELDDPALIGKVWRTLYSDSVLPRGEYQILIPSEVDQAGTGPVYLLRDGTEIGRLDLADWRQISSGGSKTSWLKRAWKSPESKDSPTVWRGLAVDWNTWLKRAEWPAEFRVGVGSTLSAIPHSNVQFERQIDFAWDQKMFRYFLVGGALHRSQFGGGLTHAWEKSQVVGTIGADPDFWGDAYWWWALSLGVPGVRYTANLANQPLPQFFWMETGADSLIRFARKGKVVTQWTGTSLALRGNVAHTVDARLACFRYSLHMDGDAYRAPIHWFGVEEVPAFFGSWGAGILATNNAAATRFWLDIPDFAFTLPMPSNYPSDFRLAFLRLDFTYRTLRSFSLGLAVTVRLDNPILNLPGL